MLFLAATLVTLLSVNVWSMTVHKCEVSATLKSDIKITSIKNVFLSKKFINQVHFNQTTLDLRIDSTEFLTGAVNGQPNFILQGNYKKGRFESAFHIGEIRCSEAMNAESLLFFKPWQQYFSVDPILSRGQILNKISLSNLKYDQVCFVGNVQDVAQDLASFLDMKGLIVSSESIEFQWSDLECVKGHGGRSDWTCDEYKKVLRTDYLNHCFSGRSER